MNTQGELGNLFLTYTAKSLHYKSIHLVKKYTTERYRELLVLNASVDRRGLSRDNETEELEKMIGEVTFDVDRLVDNISLNEAIKQLSIIERIVILRSYIYGDSQQEIANDLNLSQSSICRLKNKAIQELRQLLSININYSRR